MEVGAYALIGNRMLGVLLTGRTVAAGAYTYRLAGVGKFRR